MKNSRQNGAGGLLLFLPFMMVLAGCDSEVVKEAKRAEDNGAMVSNEGMKVLYPQTFKSGLPKYLERDFEAGADFICDEVKLKHGRDLCADSPMNWR